MENKDEIKKILPNVGEKHMQELKFSLPFAILQKFADSIKEKYEGKLSAKVVDSFKLSPYYTEEVYLPVISLYLIAPIDKGYYYRLISLQQLTNAPYPVTIHILEDWSGFKGKCENDTELESKLVEFFKSATAANIILNIIAQVDLYNEMRSKK